MPRLTRPVSMAILVASASVPLAVGAVVGAARAAVVPGRSRISVGYRQDLLLGGIPLFVAQAQAYFADAGFEGVELVEEENALPGLLGWRIDIGVTDTVEIADGVAQGLPVQLIAGYHSSADGGSTYGGDVLAAAGDLIDADPGAVTAFLAAYLRALHDVADPAAADAFLALAADAGVTITDKTLAGHAATIAEFAPFDGGFGALDRGGGVGELMRYLTSQLGSTPGPLTLIARPNLVVVQVAQVAQGLPQNPAAAAIWPVPFPAAGPGVSVASPGIEPGSVTSLAAVPTVGPVAVPAFRPGTVSPVTLGAVPAIAAFRPAAVAVVSLAVP